MKLCVIGAGAAGLSAIKNGVEHGCEVTCFELSDKVGGLWNLTDEIGVDEHGIEVHSSMYYGLRTNLPIELMCYPDLPFPEQKESFVSSEEVLRYYQWYADKFDLKRFVKFQRLVVRVRPLPGDKWEVIVRNIKTNEHETFNFDAVLVCSGHFQHGFVPKYEGQSIFKGKQYHSHDYRKPDSLKDELLLVIGGAYSGCDIVQDSSKFVKHVTWSHHLEEKPDSKFFPANVDQKPDVKRFTENGVEFVDGTFREFSVVIYCTGYEYKFPFLSVDCGISTEDGYVKPLYMHCLSIANPTLGIIGLSNLICPNQMFDLQNRFCLAFMTQRKKLPSKDQMLMETEADLDARWKRGMPKKKAHYLGNEVQERYYRDLAAMAGTKPIRPCIPKMHTQCLINRRADFGGFRKIKFNIVDDENFTMTRL
jgi:dimethylaniline monooxygenase (N-oxide forming)